VINHKKPFKKWLLGHSLSDGFLGRAFMYALLIGIAYIFLYPVFRMVTMSFMSTRDLINPEVIWIPKSLSFENYVIVERVLQLLPPAWKNNSLNLFEKIIQTFDNGGALFNSLMNVSWLALTQTVVSAFTGFAFARYQFKFKKFWFVMVLLSFVIPLPMVTVPRVLFVAQLQDSFWLAFAQVFANTPLQSVIPATLFQTSIPQWLFTFLGQGVNSAILILIFYNFFKLIPLAIDEAATMDGATHIQTFYHIYIKLMAPIIVTVFLFAFVWNWNDIFTPSVFYSVNNPSITMRLNVFDAIFSQFAGPTGESPQARINEAYKMAATLISILPLLIMYLFAQKQFIEGIERTGLTGE
jgi:multiple sugar transport system permease protein